MSGCLFKIGSGYCNKVTETGQRLCPKHIIVQRSRDEAPSRAGKASAKAREWRAQQAKALEESPLRAENPEFDKRVRRFDP